MKSILYIGVDVDDKNFNVGTFNEETKETTAFRTKPTFGNLLKKLNDLKSKGYKLKVCYEATYIGYDLCRDLRKKKIDCEIIAPSLIPELSGKKIKTDRIDGLKLAKYYAKDMLTKIYIPNEEDEETRSLIRSRAFLVKQRASIKKHILAMCTLNNINYKQETKAKNYWTNTHIEWLITKINKESDTIKILFNSLHNILIDFTREIKNINDNITKISKQEKYKNKTEILNCFRGLDTLTSMSLITEIGDIKRFIHPKKLMSYSGLDIIEYSSGGKEKKFGITKMGNKRIRTVAIEACQNVTSNTISRKLKMVRENKDKKIVKITEKCRTRLRKKALNMINRDKNKNVIKVACAREFLGFIWKALYLAEDLVKENNNTKKKCKIYKLNKNK